MNSIIRKALSLLPDRLYLDLLFYKNFDRFPRWQNPKTFNEKLQWLKLHDRNPKYVNMVDKFEVKKVVAEKIGAEYVIPTLGLWEDAHAIEWDILPRQFVLKTTHGGGGDGVLICSDINKFEKAKAIESLSKGLRHNSFYYGREWPYKHIKPRVIAEEYLTDNDDGGLADYKFFCFDGEPKALFIATDRNTPGVETRFDFYDMNFNHLPFTNGHPNATKAIQKPKGFEKMKELAKELSKGIPHVRVDFYDINGRVYFGELTFSHWSGMMPFVPEEWDYIFGSWIHLPND